MYNYTMTTLPIYAPKSAAFRFEKCRFSLRKVPLYALKSAAFRFEKCRVLLRKPLDCDAGVSLRFTTCLWSDRPSALLAMDVRTTA